MGENLYKTRWRELLGSLLPGESAQLRMAPEYRGEFRHDADPVRAAVLFLMYPIGKLTNIVFIKRNQYNGPHSAQVSLPGGAWEKADLTLEYTSLRETREELGITGAIEILGSLTDLFIPVSNFLVSPYVGYMDHTPDFHPDSSEVQFIIQTPIIQLLDPNTMGTEHLYRHDQSIVTPYYRIGAEKIWGATAMMLSEFLQLASILQEHHR